MPAFKERYWVNGKQPKMALILDGAPYHKGRIEGGLNLAEHNKMQAPNQKLCPPEQKADQRSLVKIAADLGIDSVALMRDGVRVTVQRASFNKGTAKGGLTTEELRSGMTQWILKSPAHKHLLETELERIFRLEGFEVIFTPPYSPKATPVELLWRDTKNFVSAGTRAYVAGAWLVGGGGGGGRHGGAPRVVCAHTCACVCVCVVGACAQW